MQQRDPIAPLANDFDKTDYERCEVLRARRGPDAPDSLQVVLPEASDSDLLSIRYRS